MAELHITSPAAPRFAYGKKNSRRTVTIIPGEGTIHISSLCVGKYSSSPGYSLGISAKVHE